MPKFTSLFPTIFFGLFFFIGLWIVDDYGISWDEAIQRRHGRVSIDYAAEKLKLDDHTRLEPNWHLEDYQWSNYGMIYQITANLLEQQLGWENDRYQFYKLRHVMNFLLFWLATIYFYRTLRLRFPTKDWYPMIGTLALILSPRIFAHSFYNPKDHILLVFYLISIFTLLRFLKERTWRNLILHAFATGIALNTRLPALIIPLTTACILIFELLRERPFTFRNLRWLAAYLPLSIAFMLPFFPFLWEDTVNRLIAAFSEMSDFEWDSTVLLFGDHLPALDLPAYYIPAWILITTPVIYIFFILTGIYTTTRSIVGSAPNFRLWRNENELLDFTQLGLSIGPILVVILLHSTLYNGWRHLHFVYPGLIFLLVVGFDHVQQNWARPQVQRWLLGIGLALVLVQMVRYHPHQNTFFNVAIQGKPLMDRFEMDYWGAGFRDAFLQLADQIPEGETRSVKCEIWPCEDNLKSLPNSAKAKLRVEKEWHKADYLATSFIYGQARSDRKESKHHFNRPAVEISPGGHLIIGIYRLKEID